MPIAKNPQNLMVGLRVADFLRRSYPRHAAKQLAREFDVSQPTAERWLAGKVPTLSHLDAMVARFGAPLVVTIFPEAFASHNHRIAQLEFALAQAQAEATRLAAASQQTRGEPERYFSRRETTVPVATPCAPVGGRRRSAVRHWLAQVFRRFAG